MASTQENMSGAKKPALVGGDFDPAKLRNVRHWHLPLEKGTLKEGVMFENGMVIPLKEATKDIMTLVGKLHDLCGNRLESIWSQGADKAVSQDFAITNGNLCYRVHYARDMSGLGMFTVSLLPSKLPLLSELFPTHYTKLLLGESLERGGLVLICGEAGQGKTTTASVLLQAQLASKGGIAVTLEDPPEYPLHGLYEKGYCVQTNLLVGGFKQQISDAVRGLKPQPGLLLIGELRNGEQIEETVMAACSKNLVIATIQAGSIIDALMHMVMQVPKDSRDGFCDNLSRSLRLCVHQALSESVNHIGLAQLSLLYSGRAESRVGECLSKGNMRGLKEHFNAQNNFMAADQMDRVVDIYGGARTKR